MEIYDLIKYFGIFSYTLFAITLLTGLFMKKIKIKKKFTLHKWLGIIALLSATIHVILIIKFT